MTDQEKEDGYDLFPNDDDGSEEEDFILKVIEFEINDAGIFKPTLTFKNDKCTLPLLLNEYNIFEILKFLDQTMTNITKHDFEVIKQKCTSYFKLMGAIEEK